jgi:hypothetical protein
MSAVVHPKLDPKLDNRVSVQVFESIKEVSDFLQVPIGTAAGIILTDYFGDDERMQKFWTAKFDPPAPPPTPPPEPTELAFYSTRGMCTEPPNDADIQAAWLKATISKRKVIQNGKV